MAGSSAAPPGDAQSVPDPRAVTNDAGFGISVAVAEWTTVDDVSLMWAAFEDITFENLLVLFNIQLNGVLVYGAVLPVGNAWMDRVLLDHGVGGVRLPQLGAGSQLSPLDIAPIEAILLICAAVNYALVHPMLVLEHLARITEAGINPLAPGGIFATVHARLDAAGHYLDLIDIMVHDFCDHFGGYMSDSLDYILRAPWLHAFLMDNRHAQPAAKALVQFYSPPLELEHAWLLTFGPYSVANGSSELGIKVVKWIPGDMNEKDTTIHTRFSLFAAHNDFSELLRGEYPSSAGGLEMLVELLCGEYPSSAGGLEMLVELLRGDYFHQTMEKSARVSQACLREESPLKVGTWPRSPGANATSPAKPGPAHVYTQLARAAVPQVECAPK
ncbi:hypothetical protein T492DRAFT_1151395 [Pavlovales sp. CCMP2436]|nr:hypothetical protein T492DRAFT_1151395 [Pavlovales sp. CCMP2436]